MQIREIRQSVSLMAMAVNDPDAYRAEVRTLTGYSPEELAELAGDDGILPHEPDHRTSAYVVRLPRPKLPASQSTFPFNSCWVIRR